MKNKILRLVIGSYRKARPSYYPLGDEISVETAVMQSAQAIDIACMIATKDRNVEGLLQAAEYWVKLSDFIMALSDNKRNKELDRRSDFPVGFQSANNEEKEDEDARDESDRTDTGVRVPWV